MKKYLEYDRASYRLQFEAFFKTRGSWIYNYLHGSIYGREHGFDITFEKYVFEPLYDFALCIDNPRQGIRILEKNDTIVGSVAIVEADEEKAQLRWLILIPEVRGKGLGRKLVDWAVEFCKEQNYEAIFLWTVSELNAARHIYETMGFRLKERNTHEIWEKVLTEEKFELGL